RGSVVHAGTTSQCQGMPAITLKVTGACGGVTRWFSRRPARQVSTRRPVKNRECSSRSRAVHVRPRDWVSGPWTISMATTGAGAAGYASGEFQDGRQRSNRDNDHRAKPDSHPQALRFNTGTEFGLKLLLRRAQLRLKPLLGRAKLGLKPLLG